MVVAIHQPNFIPWLGFFSKINKSDKFIFLDDAQFPKKGGTWTNRALVAGNNNKNWLTVPIERNFSGVKNINEIKILNNEIWKKKMLKTIENLYSKSFFFETIFDPLRNIITYNFQNLFELNFEILIWLFDLLKIDRSKIYLSSSLKINSISSQRLIDLTKSIGGTTYLSGDGSTSYIDETLFEAHKISLMFMNYEHPNYTQISNKSFSTGLSILDCLFNIGIEETILLISEK